MGTKNKFLAGLCSLLLLPLIQCGGTSGGSSSSGGSSGSSSSAVAVTGTFTTTAETVTATSLSLPKGLSKAVTVSDLSVKCVLLSDPTKTCTATVTDATAFSLNCDGFSDNNFSCSVLSGTTEISEVTVTASGNQNSVLATSDTALGINIDLDIDTSVGTGSLTTGTIAITNPTTVPDLNGTWTMACLEEDLRGNSKAGCGDEPGGNPGGDPGNSQGGDQGQPAENETPEEAGQPENIYFNKFTHGTKTKLGVWGSADSFTRCGLSAGDNEFTEIDFKVTIDSQDYDLDYTNVTNYKTSLKAIHDALVNLNPTFGGILNSTANMRRAEHRQRCEQMTNSNPISDSNCKMAEAPVKIFVDHRSGEEHFFIDFEKFTYNTATEYTGTVTLEEHSCGGENEPPCPPEIEGETATFNDGVSADGKPVFLVCQDPFGDAAIHFPTRATTKEANITAWTSDFGNFAGCDETELVEEENREKYRLIADLIGMDSFMFENVGFMCNQFSQGLDQQIEQLQQQFSQIISECNQNQSENNAPIPQDIGGKGSSQCLPPDFREAAEADDDGTTLTDDEAKALLRRYQPPEFAILCDPSLESARSDLISILQSSCTARVHWDFFCDDNGNCGEQIVCSDSTKANGGCYDSDNAFVARVAPRHEVMTLTPLNDPYFEATALTVERHRLRGDGGKQKFCKFSHGVLMKGKKVSDTVFDAEMTFTEKDGCFGGEQNGQTEQADQTVVERAGEDHNRFAVRMTKSE